eukprot:scaffold143471_cov142-Phaeocystis_antarctica.AAC.1
MGAHGRVSGRLERLVQEAQHLGSAHLLERAKDPLGALMPPIGARVRATLVGAILERADHVRDEVVQRGA